ncbi:MAG: M28 family peptidase [Pseudomonadales bacterium]|nr:M28 family peptidase [Pseudomonadales bacterium]MCP5356959.1 M28 family peptidase [Pseudomonadales bacterium]
MNRRQTFAGLILSLALAVPAHAQSPAATTLSTWVALDAPTGHEHWATDALMQMAPGWQRDRYGNLVKTVGSGSPHRVVACPLDAYGYAVSQITADGYLRVHRIGPGSRHPLWDQSHEGQHLRVLTAQGPVIVVSAVANGHFAAQHQNETALITQNDLWLDVGADSAEEVAALGIRLLDPVLRNLPAWAYADEVAGPRAGARISCAVAFSAAEAGLNGARGSTSYVLSVQQSLGWTGMVSALRWLPAVDELVVLDPGEAEARNEAVDSLGASLDDVLQQRGIRSLRLLAPAVRDADALMERVSLVDADALMSALVEVIRPGAALPLWVAAPAQAQEINNDPARFGPHPQRARLLAIGQTLDALAETYAVPRHEGGVRQRVLEALPAWARDRAQVDDIGNLFVEFGAANTEATVFIAHMDEVGWEITEIAEDGTLSLRSLGGVVTSAWEGQPAVLQIDTGSELSSLSNPAYLRGVFLDRASPREKRPDTVRAWFGMNGQALAAAGVRPGMGLTLHKQGHYMGHYRYASRSMDDRVGVTALLTAINELDPAQVPNRMIFAWSVQEEGGLRGAAELAKRFGDETRRAYSIDTFVSSDTPLESPHFALAPLGQGPVLRSIENGTLATPYELQRNIRVAESAGIPFQVGQTQGGTDGTRFTVYGAPNAGLSWPGRYSHSPAEISDLRDIDGLITLIKTMTMAPLEL